MGRTLTSRRSARVLPTQPTKSTRPVQDLPEQFPDLIRQRRSFLLTGHENPDGDCVGAEIALFHLLEDLGKKVVIVNPDPLAHGMGFLAAETPFDHVRGNMSLPEFDVAVLLDCCQLSRTGALAAKIKERSPVIAVVDHHVGSEDGDGMVSYVDSTAAATGVLIHRLYRHFERPLSRVAATGVFLSLVSDTGWFRFANTDAEVLALAAELARVGVEPSALYDRLYRNMHSDSAGLLAATLDCHELRLDGKLALVCMGRQLMERAARIGFETDPVIDLLRSIVGVEVVALLKERFDGGVKLSLRAKADVDVQRVAASIGGGGHKKAAGASIPGSLADAAVSVEERVGAAIAAAGGADKERS